MDDDTEVRPTNTCSFTSSYSLVPSFTSSYSLVPSHPPIRFLPHILLITCSFLHIILFTCSFTSSYSLVPSHPPIHLFLPSHPPIHLFFPSRPSYSLAPLGSSDSFWEDGCKQIEGIFCLPLCFGLACLEPIFPFFWSLLFIYLFVCLFVCLCVCLHDSLRFADPFLKDVVKRLGGNFAFLFVLVLHGTNFSFLPLLFIYLFICLFVCLFADPFLKDAVKRLGGNFAYLDHFVALKMTHPERSDSGMLGRREEGRRRGRREVCWARGENMLEEDERWGIQRESPSDVLAIEVLNFFTHSSLCFLAQLTTRKERRGERKE